MTTKTSMVTIEFSDEKSTVTSCLTVPDSKLALIQAHPLYQQFSHESKGGGDVAEFVALRDFIVASGGQLIRTRLVPLGQRRPTP